MVTSLFVRLLFLLIPSIISPTIRGEKDVHINGMVADVPNSRLTTSFDTTKSTIYNITANVTIVTNYQQLFNPGLFQCAILHENCSSKWICAVLKGSLCSSRNDLNHASYVHLNTSKILCSKRKFVQF